MTRPKDWLRSASRRTPVILALLAMIVPAIALAHAVVYPKTSRPGAYEKYVLRVPNERDVPTIRVEIHFPDSVRVVSFGEVAGWNLQVLTDSAKRITGAVWTGVLPKERFVEFPFVAVNPKASSSLSWPTIQTYQGGERVEWTSPDTASKTPVSSTVINDTMSPETDGSRTPLYVASAALLFALIALGVAMRQRGS